MERKLAAIFSTDVKGYSRLMGDDEEATIHTLKTYREVISRLIGQHHGRVIDSPGDNVLAEFASAVDAVKSAVAIQQELKTRNAVLEAHRKMEFRIGLNVGDVIIDEGRLYGDGVNIAARLEGLADPGGICLSGTVYDQIANKLTLPCTYQGEQTVKNIAKPVRTYTVQLASDGMETPTVSQAQPVSSSGEEQRALRGWPLAALALIGMLVVSGGGLVFQHFSPPLSPPAQPKSAGEASAFPLPDKPSIAVLPFTNMSGDPEQEYFSDGITDTLITDLSKLSGLFVIARNSTFTYKGKAVQVKEVSRELGVHYVLEGSVQRSDEHVRINTQLIDATTGGHVWAERYDEELTDIFTLQDEIIQRIVLALKVKLTPDEQARFRRAPTDNLEAYDYAMRGEVHWWHSTQEGNAQARQMFERAIALDPEYAAAHAFLGLTRLMDWLYWAPFQSPSPLELAFASAQRAVALDASLPLAHSVLGFVYLWKKQHARAIVEAERALALDPNSADGHLALAAILNCASRPEGAIRAMETAIRLNPSYPAQYLVILSQAYYLVGRYAEAIGAGKRALTRNPDLFLDAQSLLVFSYSESGQEEAARAEVAKLLSKVPYYSLEAIKLRSPYQDPAIVEHQLDLLHRAGMKWRWPTDNPEALGYVWAGQEPYQAGLHVTKDGKEAIAQARQMFERAIELDPQYAAAYAYLGETYLLEWDLQWSQDFQIVERAIAQAERAIALDPTEAHSYVVLANFLSMTGQPEKAIGLVKKARRLTPHNPDAYLAALGAAYYWAGQYQEARETLKKAIGVNPHDFGAHCVLAATYGALSRETDASRHLTEARAVGAECLRLLPHYSLAVARQRLPLKDPAVLERYIENPRKAGLE